MKIVTDRATGKSTAVLSEPERGALARAKSILIQQSLVSGDAAVVTAAQTIGGLLAGPDPVAQ